ncbi:hypothetical protein P3H15_44995 [Rhodococcus sp. T2V]|uniref:linalool dehydratase/isomerase domain-containing protein n=1 Tax=Rhodococcus sp. T2V TaxID=3034164 RepID=UPI0023E2AC09|nr:hypothetical protein [Rhodococcus sp. T2V]MDF3312134.1 hypothetical protein [Rhodococcus sp. T2V]
MSKLLRPARLAATTVAGAASIASAVAAYRSRPRVEPIADAYRIGVNDAVPPQSITVPAKEHMHGPATRATMRRLGLTVAASQIAGLGLLALPNRPRLNALGAGLIGPGLGHLYAKRPIEALVAAASLPVSVSLFFATGNNVAPPLAWIGTALHASRRVEAGRVSTAAPLVASALIAGTYAVERRRRQKVLADQIEDAKGVNTYLSSVELPLRGKNLPEVTAAEELSAAELAMARRLVDVALQDPNDWSNYELIDQFRESAVRYTMTSSLRALQAMQYSRMPAFRGYLSEGQRQLIRKHQQPLVWKYWMWENLWGNLSTNPDPLIRQNIMLGGWLATPIGAYERITGDLQFSEPGALNFVVDSRRSYAYSFTSMLEALADQFETSPFGLVACEPNWVYTLCNTFGATGAYLHSKVHGSDLWDRIGPRYLQGFETEFVTPTGVNRNYLSVRTGFSGPLAAGSIDSLYQRAFAPHLADRAWALTRGAFYQDKDDRWRMMFSEKGSFDAGNYARTAAYGVGLLGGAMREAGDEHLAKAAFETLQENYEVYIDDRGWLTVDGVSSFAHGELGHAMMLRKANWLNLMTKGMPDHWRNGPLLEAVPYPDVMVGRAVSNDGKGLEMVLHPGGAGGRFEVDLGQLVPGSSYKVVGAADAAITAREDGTARLAVDVRGRTEIHVVPA